MSGVMTSVAGSTVVIPDAATAYIAAMTVAPSAPRQALIVTLVNGLISDGVWNSIDWLLLMAAHDEQAARVNAKVPSKVATIVGSPVFTVDRGWTGSASNCLSTAESAIAAGNNYSQNNAFALSYVNSGSGGDTTDVYNGGNLRLASAGIGQYEGLAINSSGLTYPTSNRAFCSRIVTRSNSSTADYYENGGHSILGAASASPGSGNVRSPQSAKRVAAMGYGGGLNSTQAIALSNRITTYLTAIGAN